MARSMSVAISAVHRAPFALTNRQIPAATSVIAMRRVSSGSESSVATLGLSDAEREAIDNYLVTKHPALAESALAAAVQARIDTLLEIQPVNTGAE